MRKCPKAWVRLAIRKPGLTPGIRDSGILHVQARKSGIPCAGKMRNPVHRTIADLNSPTSGKASVLMALVRPLLIRGSGLAVDTAQWYMEYMEKREVQFAVDQAALAGAWARTQHASKFSFTARAAQEYRINLVTTQNFASAPAIWLADYAGGSQNSAIVSATAAA